MSQNPEDAVVVATQFSRLRKGSDSARDIGDAELRYEAMAALHEALDLLAKALLARSNGAEWDDARRARLEERATELGRLCASRERAAR